MAVKIAKDQCVGCESCIATCPAGALVMKDGKAEVKEDSCISCGACVSECPVQAISLPKAEREVANKEGCDLWVMAETDAGQIMGVTFELLGAAARLAASGNSRNAPTARTRRSKSSGRVGRQSSTASNASGRTP